MSRWWNGSRVPCRRPTRCLHRPGVPGHSGHCSWSEVCGSCGWEADGISSTGQPPKDSRETPLGTPVPRRYPRMASLKHSQLPLRVTPLRCKSCSTHRTGHRRYLIILVRLGPGVASWSWRVTSNRTCPFPYMTQGKTVQEATGGEFTYQPVATRATLRVHRHPPGFALLRPLTIPLASCPSDQ